MEAKALVESYLGAEADGDTVAYLLQLVELLDLEDESAYEECAAVFFEYKSDLCQGAETEADTTVDSSSSSSSKALVAKLHDILHTKGKTQSASSKKVAGSSSPSSASLATTTGAKAKGIVSASPASEADIIADMKQQMAKIHSFMKEQEATSQRGAREGEENSPQEDGKMQTEGAALEGGAKKEAIAQSVSVLEEICDNFQKQKLLEQEQQREEEEEDEDDESKTKQRQAGAVESIERDTLESVLQEVCGGDLSAAALWVTENDVLTYQALLRKKRVDAEERERDSKKNNEKIFKQYGLRPVSNSDQNSNLARAAIAQKKSLRKAGGGPQSQHPQKRYHNNQVVVSKGEKYFTVKEGEEWDGGSRGKVISKGKRGKGFT